MNAIDILIIMTGFILLSVLLFIQAQLSVLNKISANDTFLRKAFIQKPRSFSLYCAIGVTIGIIMMIAPAISFFYENSSLYGIAATAMLFIGSPVSAIRTYQKLMGFDPSANK